MFYSVFLSYSVIKVRFHCISVFSSIFLCISLVYLGYISAFMSSQNNPDQTKRSKHTDMRGAPRLDALVPRGMTIDEHMGLFG